MTVRRTVQPCRRNARAITRAPRVSAMDSRADFKTVDHHGLWGYVTVVACRPPHGHLQGVSRTLLQISALKKDLTRESRPFWERTRSRPHCHPIPGEKYRLCLVLRKSSTIIPHVKPFYGVMTIKEVHHRTYTPQASWRPHWARWPLSFRTLPKLP